MKLDSIQDFEGFDSLPRPGKKGRQSEIEGRELTPPERVIRGTAFVFADQRLEVSAPVFFGHDLPSAGGEIEQLGSRALRTRLRLLTGTAPRRSGCRLPETGRKGCTSLAKRRAFSRPSYHTPWTSVGWSEMKVTVQLRWGSQGYSIQPGDLPHEGWSPPPDWKRNRSIQHIDVR